MVLPLKSFLTAFLPELHASTISESTNFYSYFQTVSCLLDRQQTSSAFLYLQKKSQNKELILSGTQTFFALHERQRISCIARLAFDYERNAKHYVEKTFFFIWDGMSRDEK